MEITAQCHSEQETPEALSKKYHMSRTTIGRVLRQAREEGIVEITVRTPPAVSAQLEQEFVWRFGVGRVLIAADNRNSEVQRSTVASLVADYLNKTLADGMIVVVGTGPNVGAVDDSIYAPTQQNVIFISAIGGLLRAGTIMSPDHICWRLAARFGGESETLYASALVANPKIRAALMQNDTIKRTLDRARCADIAPIGIGDLSEDSNIVRLGRFSRQEMVEARLSGTIGDIVGYDFINIDGNECRTPMEGQIIGLSMAELKRIPT